MHRARYLAAATAPCLLAISCEAGMGVVDPFGGETIGPHEIEVAGAEPTTVAILLHLDTTKPITAYVGVAIEGVVIDRGPAGDIDMHLYLGETRSLSNVHDSLQLVMGDDLGWARQCWTIHSLA